MMGVFARKPVFSVVSALVVPFTRTVRTAGGVRFDSVKALIESVVRGS
jgi:hypothetical protein